MRKVPWREVSVLPDIPMRVALETLERTAAQILLVVDASGVLVGTVTDGDVRRALLARMDFEARTEDFMNTAPATGSRGILPDEAAAIMHRLSIHALPIVDEQGRVLDLLFAAPLQHAPERDTAVLIMAGGRGQRLRPLTDTTPKPLIKVGGMPLAEATVRRLTLQGFRHFWFALHYRAQDIQRHFGDGTDFGVEINYLREKEPLGTAGALRLLPSEQNVNVLVINGDVLSSIEFGLIVDFHRAENAAATIGAIRHTTEFPFGVIHERDGILMDIEEKPIRQDLISAGVTVISRRAMSHFPKEGAVDMPDFIRMLVAKGERVAVAKIDTYWLDVGTQTSLQTGQRDHHAGD
jgi:dTDP-glucose pyrophosphorylase